MNVECTNGIGCGCGCTGETPDPGGNNNGAGCGCGCSGDTTPE